VSNSILIKDNFFDSVDELSELAHSADYMYHLNTPISVVWRGYRTWELSYLNNPIISKFYQEVLESSSEYFNLKEDHSMEMYFHMSYEKDNKSQLRKWHKDNTSFAGLIYLTPDAPVTAGTTVFVDGEQINVENKYNRLIVYSGSLKHGPTGYFGETLQDVRRTLVFFMDLKDEMDKHCEFMNKMRLKYNS